MLLAKTIRQIVAEHQPSTPALHDVYGWVSSVRLMKNVAFVTVSDGTTSKGLQVIAHVDAAKRLTTGTSVQCIGPIQKSLGKEQSLEMQASSITVIGECPSETYPLQKKAHSLEFLRDISHLRPRSRLMAAVLRLRSEASWAVHEYFKRNDFTLVNTPILTSTDCEGAGEMFVVATPGEAQQADPSEKHKFFGVPTYLTVSGQLQAEIAASALTRVYTFGPTFRAENSQTVRHLAEFWMLEAEAAFVRTLPQLNSITAGLLHAVVSHVLSACRSDLEVFDAHACDVQKAADQKAPSKSSVTDHLEALLKLDGKYASMTYTEAIRHLEPVRDKFKNTTDWGHGLHIEHERFLAEQVVGAPIFITDYPRDIKPFYMRSNDRDGATPGETVAAVDLLVPRVGELVGGSLREERLPILEEQMARHKLDSSTYSWYTDLRRFGSVPHGGFGMGFERLILFLSGLDNIRDAVPFPRHPGRCQF